MENIEENTDNINYWIKTELSLIFNCFTTVLSQDQIDFCLNRMRLIIQKELITKYEVDFIEDFEKEVYGCCLIENLRDSPKILKKGSEKKNYEKYYILYLNKR